MELLIGWKTLPYTGKILCLKQVIITTWLDISIIEMFRLCVGFEQYIRMEFHSFKLVKDFSMLKRRHDYYFYGW